MKGRKLWPVVVQNAPKVALLLLALIASEQCGIIPQGSTRLLLAQLAATLGVTSGADK